MVLKKRYDVAIYHNSIQVLESLATRRDFVLFEFNNVGRLVIRSLGA